jgi:hypothetical protein
VAFLAIPSFGFIFYLSFSLVTATLRLMRTQDRLFLLIPPTFSKSSGVGPHRHAHMHANTFLFTCIIHFAYFLKVTGYQMEGTGIKFRANRSIGT